MTELSGALVGKAGESPQHYSLLCDRERKWPKAFMHMKKHEKQQNQPEAQADCLATKNSVPEPELELRHLPLC